MKSPLGVSERPASPEISGRRTRWDRDAIFASGALTLPELLAQVPGVTLFQSGFIAAPTATAWLGEPGRVRVFLDGVELDGLDSREGGVRDLGVIQLWSLEEVSLERAAGELRVHLRSWRVHLTTPQTRTDILTGSENTNLYRGFFGKRMESGGVLQIAAQQYSTTSVRTGGDGDALAAFARVGVVRGRLSLDGVANRFGRTRSATARNVVSGTPDPTAIAGFEGKDVSAYLRAAWGNPDSSGFWAQGLAATLQRAETGDTTAMADTARSQSQYVAVVGFRRSGASVAATARLRAQEGKSSYSPSVRGSWDRGWLSASAFAEEGGPDSTRRMDGVVTLAPLPWFHLSASHSIHTPDSDSLDGPARTTSRAEVGLRFRGRWLTAGLVERSESLLPGMPVFDPRFVPILAPAASGITGGLAGQVWGPFSFSWRGVRWAEESLYRPLVESYAELRVSTGFERQIKRGTFHLTGALTHQYRGSFDAPVGGGATLRAEGAGLYGSMLEMRIGTAYIFWYNQNAVGTVYESVPGYLMPRLVQLYGVRWEFWN